MQVWFSVPVLSRPQAVGLEPRRLGPVAPSPPWGWTVGTRFAARASLLSGRCLSCQDRHDYSVPALRSASQKLARIWLAPQALGSIRPQYHRPRSGGRSSRGATNPRRGTASSLSLTAGRRALGRAMSPLTVRSFGPVGTAPVGARSGQRECGHPWPGPTRRPTHPLPRIHQIRRRGRGRHHADLRPLPLAALLRPDLTHPAVGGPVRGKTHPMTRSTMVIAAPAANR